MNASIAEALKADFCSQARLSFDLLKDEMVATAKRTYSGNPNLAWIAATLEDTLKEWILNGGIPLKSCTDSESILARLNRLAGEKFAELKRGQWQFEKLPPTSLLYQESETVDMDEQYAVMRSLHQLLDQWEKINAKRSCALEMYFWGGYNYTEISHSLGVSDWTAKKWVNAGVAYLRKALKGGCPNPV